MTQAPRVTVVTVTYNGSRFLAATIESVLCQTFADFEYLIVDNASIDESRQIAESYAAQDQRVRVVDSPVNLGPGGGLNLALAEARGEFFANLDHDDLAVPQRLAVQVAALDANPAVGVVGGWMRRIDEDGRVKSSHERRLSHAGIHWRLMTQCELVHSSVTFRRDLIMTVGGYSPLHHLLCDYELFGRLRDRTHFLNIADYLVAYRSYSQQSSHRYRATQHLQMLLLQQAIYRDVSGQDLALQSWHNFSRATRGEALQDPAALLDAAAVAEAIASTYLARYTPTPDAVAMVRHDCALWLLTMAVRHRRLMRQTADTIYRRALACDPTLWETQGTMRTLRRACRHASEVRVADPRIVFPRI